jgi:hypothetical protein
MAPMCVRGESGIVAPMLRSLPLALLHAGVLLAPAVLAIVSHS